MKISKRTSNKLSIRFSYAYPYQRLEPRSRANHPSKRHLNPKLWRVNRIFFQTRAQPKIPMKNFSFGDHENAFVKQFLECICACRLCICIWIWIPSPLGFQSVFQFVLPARRHLHPRNYGYVDQKVELASRILYVRNRNRISGYFA